MQIVWKDEFQGTSVDMSKWGLDSTQSWQNGSELQYYTDRSSNVFVNGGLLTIRSVKENIGGKTYSSGKLNAYHSQNPVGWVGGLFEARIKMPVGVGVWPAFWLLGQDNLYTWPSCGEIDVVETPVIGGMPLAAYSTVHVANLNMADVTVPGNGGLVGSVGDWHTYGVLVSPSSVEFFIDHRRVRQITRTVIENMGGIWTFDHLPVAPILNLAVGGWAGAPGVWESQDMLVDWVRVWQ
jgi:beta-glucanase (GH16 family)